MGGEGGELVAAAVGCAGDVSWRHIVVAVLVATNVALYFLYAPWFRWDVEARQGGGGGGGADWDRGE